MILKKLATKKPTNCNLRKKKERKKDKLQHCVAPQPLQLVVFTCRCSEAELHLCSRRGLEVAIPERDTSV